MAKPGRNFLLRRRNHAAARLDAGVVAGRVE
jgi:hypothetical protein